MLFQFECANSSVYEGKKLTVLVDIAYPYTFLSPERGGERASKACLSERAQNKKEINTPRSL